MKIAGYILAGGKNRRMDGKKKLFLEYGGEYFYRRILRAFQSQGISPVYLSVEECSPYEAASLPLVADVCSGAGPLGGIYTGLLSCPEEALFVAACDMPCIGGGDVKQLLDAYQRCPGIVVSRAEGRLQPLFAIYPVSALPFFEKALGQKDYRMMHVLDEAGYQAAALPETSAAAKNINTPEAYQTLLKADKLSGKSER